MGATARRALMMWALFARESRSIFSGTMSPSRKPTNASRDTKLSAPQVSRNPADAATTALSAVLGGDRGVLTHGRVVPERLHCGEVQVVATHLGATAVDAGEDLEDVFGALDGRGDHGDALLLPRLTEALQSTQDRLLARRLRIGSASPLVSLETNVVQSRF